MRDFPLVYKRNLYDEGTDSTLQQLGEMNILEARTQPPRRLLDHLLDGDKPFHHTITPPPPGEPLQVIPAPQPPMPQRARSILKR